jgi:hypothetical protein
MNGATANKRNGMETTTLKNSITAATTLEQYQEIEKQIDAYEQQQRAEIRELRNALMSAATGEIVEAADIRLDELDELLAEEDEDGEPLDPDVLADRWDERDFDYEGNGNLDRAYDTVELLRAARMKWYADDDPVLAIVLENREADKEAARAQVEQQAAATKAMNELADAINVNAPRNVTTDEIVFSIGGDQYVLHAGCSYGPNDCRVENVIGIVRPGGDLNAQKFMRPAELIAKLCTAVAS